MSRRWSAPLEALGRLGLPRILPAALFRRPLAVGDPTADDARRGSGWRDFLDDSVLPGPGVLRRHGLERVVYVAPADDDEPLADLEGYFGELLLEGIAVFCVGLATPDATLTPFSSPRKARRLIRSSYRRSAVGGFGTLVPEPSSGGGG